MSVNHKNILKIHRKILEQKILWNLSLYFLSSQSVNKCIFLSPWRIHHSCHRNLPEAACTSSSLLWGCWERLLREAVDAWKVGRGTEQPGPMKGAPIMAGVLEQDDFLSPLQPKAFWDGIFYTSSHEDTLQTARMATKEEPMCHLVPGWAKSSMALSHWVRFLTVKSFQVILSKSWIHPTYFSSTSAFKLSKGYLDI